MVLSSYCYSVRCESDGDDGDADVLSALAQVFSFVRLAELYYAGSHGMDIRGPTADPNHHGKVPYDTTTFPNLHTMSSSPSFFPFPFPSRAFLPTDCNLHHHQAADSSSSVLCQPASEFLPVMEEVYAALVSRVEPSIPGAKVENNKFCLSVHFRCVEEAAWAPLFELVRAVLRDYPGLRLTQGRKVLEVRPMIRWDKGKALEFLLTALGFADADKDDVFPIYVGDDRTDEDAFRVLRARGQGAGILVSRFPKETSASFTLRDPAEVKDFLRKLVVVNADADTNNS